MSAFKKACAVAAVAATLITAGAFASSANAAVGYTGDVVQNPGDLANTDLDPKYNDAVGKAGEASYKGLYTNNETRTQENQIDDTVYFDTYEYGNDKYAVVTGYHNYLGDNSTMTIKAQVKDSHGQTWPVRYVGYGRGLDAKTDDGANAHDYLKHVVFDGFSGIINYQAFKGGFNKLETIDLGNVKGNVTIKELAFAYLPAVKSINIPYHNVDMTIEEAAFFRCGPKAAQAYKTPSANCYHLQGAYIFTQSALIVDLK